MNFTALCACRRDGAIGLFDTRTTVTVNANDRDAAALLVPAALRKTGYELYYIVALYATAD